MTGAVVEDHPYVLGPYFLTKAVEKERKALGIEAGQQ
jgi:hypothetical protein